MKNNKLAYKIFILVLIIVSFITFLIMNYNPVQVTFIFFSAKIPLTLLFFICFFIGALFVNFFWNNKYKILKQKLERTEKLLFKKENIYTESQNEENK